MPHTSHTGGDLSDGNENDCSDSPCESDTVRALLEPLASLKLTVVLFTLAILLVLAGTLAQHRKGIWDVMDQYFRTPFWPTLGFAWVEFQDLLPRAFFPSGLEIAGGFPFPGGWLIGSLMAVNLLCAHILRFKIEAEGSRLLGGVATIAAGLVLTWATIASGSSQEGVLEGAVISWSALWLLSKVTLGVACLAMVWALSNIGPGRRTERWILIASLIGLGGLLAWLLYQGDAAKMNDSSMRILWQLIKGTVASLVLLAGCTLLFRKHAAVQLIHGGIALMMLSELLVGTTVVESRMSIREGETVNFVYETRAVELAIVDDSDPDFYHVVAVPRSMLLASQTIQHEELPFDIEIVRYLENATLRRAKIGEKNPATAGIGQEWMAEAVLSSTGTDSSVNMPAVYVTFKAKNGDETLGTHLVSLLVSSQDMDEAVSVREGGVAKTYRASLRFKRTYKDFSIHLIDVRKDDYVGTDMARNYSSEVQLVDKARNVRRTIPIWMNNPLRFAGDTFYQSGYHDDPTTGVETTTLQVVANESWMIPYVSCMIVATGMLAYFWLRLLHFLNAHAGAVTSKRSPARAAGIVVPLAVVLLAAMGLAWKARIPETPAGKMKLDEFGSLPLIYQGRVKPIDTLARNSLRMISDAQSFVDNTEKRQPAIRWFLDTITRRDAAFQHKVFRIRHPEVLETLGLKRRKGFRYALEEFNERIDELTKQARLARSAASHEVSLYQRNVLELERKLGVIDLLLQSCSPPTIRHDTHENARADLMAAMQAKDLLAARHPPLMVPPDSPEAKWECYHAAWLNDLVRAGRDNQPGNPALESLRKILDAYAEKDAAAFNSAVAGYRASLEANPPSMVDPSKTEFEAFFNHFAPFHYASFLYVAAFVLAALAWLGWSRPLNRTSFWLIVLTLAVHTFALAARVYISGRPPVTNLYSTAVFVGWGCVVLGLILESLYPRGIGNVISAIAGFATLLIAYYLAGDGDTLVVLQAVLDTQFWLTTHVVTIALGYSATFLAGLLGVVYILRGVLTPTLTPTAGKELERMMYGSLCFAIFFSFIGTVLGGLWADDSWGRFWGWDPKENGALIIVLWNALVLHAHRRGMVHERGLALLVVGGNIVTSWSWFGVNELGVGLHAYGFTEGVLLALGLFVLSQLAVIGVGLVPQDSWPSHRAHQDQS